MMSDSQLGVAVWGVGRHAQRNALPALASCPDVRLVGLTTRNAQVLRAEAARWECRQWSTADEMLGDEDVDVVYLATPNGLHYSQGSRVLEAGAHLWCEKPLTADLMRTTELCGDAQRRGLMVAEAFMYQHHPQFTRLQQRLAAGDVGRVKSITARFGFPHLNSDNVRYDAKLDGGALLDVGVYPLSACLALLGPEPESVHATLERDEGYEVDVGGAALLVYEAGEHALLEWGFGRAYRNELEIWGEEGTMLAERAFSKPAEFEARLRISRQDGEVDEERVGAANHFELMFSAFAEATREPERREYFLARALRQARLVQAIRDVAGDEHQTAVPGS